MLQLLYYFPSLHSSSLHSLPSGVARPQVEEHLDEGDDDLLSHSSASRSSSREVSGSKYYLSGWDFIYPSLQRLFFMKDFG